MTEIIPIWLEKVRQGWKITADRRGKWLKLFPYGWKKSDMVGKLLRIEEGKDWNYSHMVGKSPTWSENYSGWKATNSDMVGNFPQGVRKGVPSHRTFSLSHPSYRREFPIPFSISAHSPFMGIIQGSHIWLYSKLIITTEKVRIGMPVRKVGT